MQQLGSKYFARRPPAPLPQRMGSKDQNSTFTEHGHVLYQIKKPGRVAQSATCLATDASLTADPGVASSIPIWSHTFVGIDYEIISKGILLPSAESFKKDFCQLQAKICARSTGNCLLELAQEKSVVRRADRPAMAIDVDLGCKATKTNEQTNKQNFKLKGITKYSKTVVNTLPAYPQPLQP